MRMYDILAKKRDTKGLSDEEISFVVKNYTSGNIPDYQMSAFLMAVFINGMSAAETSALTASMANSGDIVDLTEIEGIKADKHSTGGVGDKTTLVVGPLVAACGVKVAKMSGRGLGHTGGTIDKMEAIDGLRTTLTIREFIDQVNNIGIAVVGQSGNLAPADKKIYALRDVTATVSSLPLIAASIMSKKLASGADTILLDVKTGNGAFMKTLPDSIALAKTMVEIGQRNGRKTAALITDMGTPLGVNIGNSLEVIEAVETLKGKGPEDLTTVCLHLAAGILQLAEQGNFDFCLDKAKQCLQNGKAFDKFVQMVAAQSGSTAQIKDPSLFKKAGVSHEVFASDTGYISAMDTEKIGTAAVVLGAGRETKESKIDYSAGIRIKAKTGSFVQKGDIIALLETSSKEKAISAKEIYLSAIEFSQTKPAPSKLILAKVNATNTEIL